MDMQTIQMIMLCALMATGMIVTLTTSRVSPVITTVITSSFVVATTIMAFYIF